MKKAVKKKIVRAGAAAKTAARRPVVLIADDDPDWRLLVRDALSGDARLGALDLYEVPDGQTALEFLMREGPHAGVPPVDLVYLDCEMPRLDGFALLKQMQRISPLRNVAVIMLTGVCDETSMRKALELGATGWIVKPTSVPELKRALIASARHSLDRDQGSIRQRKHAPKWAA